MLLKNCTLSLCISINCSSSGNNSANGVGKNTSSYSCTGNEHHHFSVAFQVCGAVLLISMFMAAVFGNVVVCYIVYQKPAMRSAINLLLSNLAFVDVSIALVCMSSALVTLLAERWVMGEIFCSINAFFFSFLVTESTYILLAISWDRYLIIVRREETLTPYKAKVVILITWLMSLVVALPPTVGWGKYDYPSGHIQCRLNDTSLSYSTIFYCVTMLGPMILMAYIFYKILCTVRRNSMKVINHPPVASVETRIHKHGKLNFDYGFKTRAFLTILILFVGYFFCFLPYLVARLVSATSKTLSVPTLVEAILILICYLKSAINPVVYYLRISKFREACWDIMPSCCCFSLLCMPKRPLRRICPHVVYEITDNTDKSSSISFYSAGVFDLYKPENM